MTQSNPNKISLDQSLYTLRSHGQVEIVLGERELQKFRRCCARIDTAATLSQSYGFLGKLLFIFYLPLFIVLNAFSTRGDGDCSVMVDLYAVARGELQSVTGEGIGAGQIKVCFLHKRAEQS